MPIDRSARIHSREPVERSRPAPSAVAVVAGPRSPFPLSGLVHPVRRLTDADDALGGTAVVSETASALERLRGAGTRLPESVAGPMGEAMGADLSTVRVHADPEADQISRSLQATAFTHGQDIYFTQGSYAPGTQSGQRLLAHELAHVVQARSGVHLSASGSAPTIGHAADPAEAAADAMAETVLATLRRHAVDADPVRGSDIGHGLSRLRRTPAPVIRRIFSFAPTAEEKKGKVDPALAKAVEASRSYEQAIADARETIEALEPESARVAGLAELEKIEDFFEQWDGYVDVDDRSKVVQPAIDYGVRLTEIADECVALAQAALEPVVEVATTKTSSKPRKLTEQERKAAKDQERKAKYEQKVAEESKAKTLAEDKAKAEQQAKDDVVRAGVKKSGASPEVNTRLTFLGGDELIVAADIVKALILKGVPAASVLAAIQYPVHGKTAASDLIPAASVPGFLALAHLTGATGTVGLALAAGVPLAGTEYTPDMARALLQASWAWTPQPSADGIAWLLGKKTEKEFPRIYNLALDKDAKFSGLLTLLREPDPVYTLEETLTLCERFKDTPLALSETLKLKVLDTDLPRHAELIMEYRNTQRMDEEGQLIALRAIAHFEAGTKPKIVIDDYAKPFGRTSANPNAQENTDRQAMTGFLSMQFDGDGTWHPIHTHWYHVGDGKLFAMHMALDKDADDKRYEFSWCSVFKPLMDEIDTLHDAKFAKQDGYRTD